MANRTYLCGLNQDFFADDKIELNVLVEARYALPLLWFALFRPEDIKLYSNVPILLTSREQALANLDRAAPGLRAFLGEPASAVVGQWRAFIEQKAFAHYLANTHELHMMEEETGEFEGELRQWLAEFDAIVTGTAPTRELRVIAQADRALAQFPYQGSPLHLCGYTANGPVPWQEATQE